MKLATRTEVLELELISSSSASFRYSERQLLRSGEPDVVERMIHRKQRRMRWGQIAVLVVGLAFVAQGIIVWFVERDAHALVPITFWPIVLTVYCIRIGRDRLALVEAGERLLRHLEELRQPARRTG
ncbi:MAG: hypothetical protein AAGD14_01440 [Planctomycetota bacterium]